ncbi:MAG: endo-1,4-beta-xylanase [Pontiellaceae bacterium]|nr:endo-1,4-beta-xylanase [Pontiellaceae bacterium]MBN2784807.1 endo-1,4-beta-xylanase [Pontiellaceae bacterium]
MKFRMLKWRRSALLLMFFALFLCAALAGQETLLKDAYKDQFLIGAAVGERYVLQSSDQAEKALHLLEKEFNCVTSENLMKPASLQPERGRFTFDQADRFVKMAKQMDLAVVGHVLVWHSQTPRWFFEDASGKPLSRDEGIENLRDHIRKVVKRYKGHVKYWDVVNEAVDVRMVDDPDQPPNPDGTPRKKPEAFFRDSPWLRVVGEDYIELAFRFAHEADPKAILIYNDYGMTDPVKVDFVIRNIVRPLKKKGVHIDAVGMQGHWHMESPGLDEIEESIEKLAAAKVKVHITELDLSVLPMAYGYTGADINTRYELQDELNPYKEGIPQEVLEQQAARYRAFFDIFRSHRRDIERVTFWGICDEDSWKNGFPVRGRTDYPLLFDRNYQPKPAYHALAR